jgi:phage terminase large subunit-like protein
VPAGGWVRKAARRHLDDRARELDPDYPYTFKPKSGGKVCRFIEKLPHTKGQWAAQHELLKLQPWQCFLVVVLFGWLKKSNGKRRFRSAYFEIPRKNGKAASVETPVPTPTGWRKHGDLRPGDYVFAPDGKPVRVIASTEPYAGPCMRMEFCDGSSVTTHEAHEWVTERKWYTGRRRGPNNGAVPPLETKQIAATLRTSGARQDFVHRIPVAGPLAYSQAHLPIDPYVLGAWLGDGSKRGSTITVADDEILEHVKAAEVEARVVCNAGVATTYRVGRSYRNGTAAKETLQGRLRALGLLLNKHIPAAYLQAGLQQRLELLRGLIDTDGTVSKRGQVVFTNTNRRLIDGLVELVRSLGMKPTLREHRAKLYGVDCGPCWEVQFWPPADLDIAYVARKQSRVTTGLRSGKRRSAARTVVNVTPAGVQQVNCIQVEGAMYLVGEAMVPTHNSIIAAGIGLYMLLADNEFGAEVYSGATSEKQAWEVFKPAKLMLTRSPDLCKALGGEVCAKALVRPSNGSKFEPVIGNPGDGPSPSCAIVDEYHEHQTPALYDSMETGMGAREQPLMLVITTAGYNIAGPCHEKHTELCKVLDGVTANDELFGCIFGIDPQDDWADPKSLVKANPNYGVSVDAEFLRSQQRQAMANPVQQNKFKTKHLNVWCSVLAGWMNMQEWTLAADPLLDEDEIGADGDCWIAIDLASKSDMCAEQRLYRRMVDASPHYYLFGRYWLPEAAVEERGPNAAHYAKWIKLGLLTQTDGATVDFEQITEQVVDDCKRINPIEVVFDPFNATQMAQALMVAGVKNVVEFVQQPQNFALPMDELAGALKDGRFHHDGNEITTWCFSNVVARPARKGLFAPVKSKPHQKIDGAVAAIMAVGRASASDRVAEREYQMIFV